MLNRCLDPMNLYSWLVSMDDFVQFRIVIIV